MSKKIVSLGLIIAAAIIPVKVLAIGESCEFSGTARYKGRYVTSSDPIQANDAGGQNCTNGVYYYANGFVVIYVKGDDPATTDVDEGAPEGGVITFRINGEVANVSGSNVFHNLAPQSCDLEVPDTPPNANPGGPYSGAEGSSVQFSGSGSTGAATYAWDFGDGGTSGLINPTHAYGDNSTYTVSLTVTNNSGQSNTKTTTATITNVVPTVSASSNAPQSEGSSVSFTGGYTDPGSNDAPFTFSWNFGDGQTATQQNPTHTYADDGTYTVTLSVKDKDNGTGTKQITVVINNVNPTVDAGSDQTTNEGSSVTFTGNATDPGVNDVLTYNWNFDDGGSTTGKTVSHSFADNGTYHVVLTVTDGDGGSATDNCTVTVNNVAPTARAGGPYVGVINLPIQFYGSATDPGSADVSSLVYTWDLDADGQYGDYTGPSPNKTYSSVGTYTIALKVTDKDGGSGTNSTTVEVNIGTPVTFTTSPAGLQVKVDGQYYTTPTTLYLIPGSNHSIEAPYSQGESSGLRQAFYSWSDGGSIIHNIAISTSAVSYNAEYRTQYFLDIDTGGKGGNPQGEGWYYGGMHATISVDAEVINPEQTMRYRFLSWTGTGQSGNAYSGSSITADITMTGPVTETVNWSAEYRLLIQDDRGTGVGGGWYVENSTVTISVAALVADGTTKRYIFLSWQGEGNESYTGSNNPVNVKIKGPIVERATWRAQYYLNIETNYGNATGEGWYDANGFVTISIDTIAPISTGVRMHFLNWEGSGSGSSSSITPIISVQMNGPIIETAQWEKQYYLDVKSDHGNPKGTGWYDEGTMVHFSVDSTETIGTGSRFRFASWTGTGSGSYSGVTLAPSRVIEGPIKETANWTVQHFLSIGVEPQYGGRVDPFQLPGGWVNESSEIELKAVGNEESGYGFSYWSGDTSGSTNPLPIKLNTPKSVIAHFEKGHVIVNSSPPGLTLLIDGVRKVSPAVFNWHSGEHHTLGVVTPQGDNVSKKYIFTTWSDHGAESHDITVTDEQVTYTASFLASYFLEVESDYGTPSGEDWYYEGDFAMVSIDSVVEMSSGGVHQKFAGWEGTGEGSVTHTDRIIQVLMSGPITEKAQWMPEFKLQVKTYPSVAPGAQIDVIPSRTWYASGESVQLSVVILDPEYSFTGWSGGVSGSDNPVTLIMKEPKTVTAHFKTPNPPPVIQSLPDTVMLENGELKLSFLWLSQYVSDPNDSFESLIFNLEGANHFQFTLDASTQQLKIWPDSHWSGIENIILNISDPMGVSSQDTFSIQVLPVFDAPEKFNLLSPQGDAVLPFENAPIEFVWELSHDYDPGDQVSYSFFMSTSPSLSGLGTMVISSIQDTAIFLILNKSDGVYYWAVRADDKMGNQTWSNQVFMTTIKTGVDDSKHAIPTHFDLSQNFPNPFNPLTTFSYQLPNPSRVTIRIFDARGCLVKTLVDGRRNAGIHRTEWDGKNEDNRSAASGVYIVQMQAEGFIQYRKILLIR